MCSCHSIPECCVMFSGVKLSMASFILLLSKSGILTTMRTSLNNSPDSNLTDGAAARVFKKAGLRQWLHIWPTIGLPFGMPLACLLACLLAYPWAYMLPKLKGHVLQYRRARDQ